MAVGQKENTFTRTTHIERNDGSNIIIREERNMFSIKRLIKECMQKIRELK